MLLLSLHGAEGPAKNRATFRVGARAHVVRTRQAEATLTSQLRKTQGEIFAQMINWTPHPLFSSPKHQLRNFIVNN